MVVLYIQAAQGDKTIQATKLSKFNIHLISQALWIDLLSPSKEEEHWVESQIELDIPTKNEVEEIEPSSRLYLEDNAFFMTATLVAYSDLPQVKTDVVTFIYNKKQLITVRYAELHAFKWYTSKILPSKRKTLTAAALFLELLDATIERLADILEKIAHNSEEISRSIFYSQTKPGEESMSYKRILQNIGSHNDLGNKVRESLVSFMRLIAFLEQSFGANLSKTLHFSLALLNKDVKALSDYASFLSTKFNFLLDATLGMINIEQNNIIKIFSVAAVMFLPPTLIASIYGMNFHHIPELHWMIGYPLALVLMFLSALLPFKYFKRKKWL